MRGRKRLLTSTQWYRIRRARRITFGAYADRSMARPRTQRPVLVVGMHRSGTTVTARILETLGLDLGHDVTRETHESLAYRCRNDALLRATGASWDHPLPFTEVARDPEWRRALAVALDSSLRAPWQWLLTDPHRAPRSDDWGWKDPRTSITWPVWLELFPNARFVRVRRNRDDVVASLVARGRRQLRSGAGTSIRAHSEDGAAGLAAEYQAALALIDEMISPTQVVDVCYEELTAAPRLVIGRLASSLGLDPARVDEAAALVRSPTS
jgi:hypothetical protein